MRDIEAIIDKARAVVVLWSELSLQSDFVMGEALKAASLGSYIGVTIEPDVKAPVAFLAKHNLALDLASSPEARIALAAQLERRLGAPRAPAPPEETVAERLAEPAPEAEFWRGIHDGARAKDFEAYLAKYGQDGLFAELARGRIAALRKPAAPATSQGPSRDAALIASPAGTVFRDSFLAPIKMRHDEEISEGPELCVIPAGRFLMGSPAEEPERFDGEGPQHEVRIARPFALGRYAVTFDEYDAFCAATRARRPGDAGWGRGRRPAIKVSWKDADAYCGWLSEQTGATYRLPSEAEWEYACWAGTTTPFWWGREITPEQANYNGDYAYAGGGAKGVYRKKTEPVDAFTPNPWGLYQTHGNVSEWSQDCWNENYQGAPADGSPWMAGDCSRAVLRGGSWSYRPRLLRSASRSCSRRGSYSTGFRLARTLGTP